MPLNATIAKNNAKLDPQQPDSFIPDVSMNIAHVQGQQSDPSQVMRALDGLGEFFGAKGKQERQKLDFAAQQRGAKDAEQGTVDNGMMAQSEAYKEAVNSTQGQAEALQWFSKARTSLAEAQRQNPNMDFEEWRKTALADLFATPNDDPHALAAKNKMAGVLESQLRESFYQTQAKDLHDEADKAFTQKNLALVEAAGGKVTPEGIDAMIASGKQSGLTEQEARESVGKSMAALISTGNTGIYESLSQSKAQLHLDGVVGTHLQKAYEVGQAAEQKKTEEANLIHGTELFKTMQGAYATAQSGGFGFAQAQQLQGKVPDQHIMSLMDMSMRKNMEDAKRNADLAAEVKSRQQLVQVLGRGNDAWNYVGLPMQNGKPVTHEALQETLDTLQSNAFFGMRKAIESGDPNAIAQSTKAMQGQLELGVKTGLIPTSVKYQLENASLSNPDAFQSNARAYQVMKQNGMGPYIEGMISSERRAQYDQFIDLTSNGTMAPAQALQAMAAAPVKLDDANKRVNNMAKEVDTAVRATLKGGDFGGFLGFGRAFDPSEGHGYGLVRQIIERDAAARVSSTGQDAVSAIAAAQKHVSEAYDIIGGVPINKAQLSLAPEFASTFKDYEKYVLIPKFRETMGDAADSMSLTIAPVRDKPGNFYVIPTNIGQSAPMQDPKTGSFLTFSQAEMFDSATRAKRDAKVKLDADNKAMIDSYDNTAVPAL